MANSLDSLRANWAWWLKLRCGCGRVTLLPVAVLAERHGLNAKLPELVAQMRCLGCGAKPNAVDLIDEPHTDGAA